MKKLYFSLILCLGATFLHAQGLVAPGGTVGDSGNGSVGIGTTDPIAKLEVNGTIKAGGNYLNVLSYQLAGTPTHGVKIKTQIPFNNQGGMFSIDIKGYNYMKSSPLAVKLNFYMYGSPDLKFIRYKASSSGNWNPKIKLAEENGLVVVFIDEKEYYLRFGVDVYAPWHSYQNDAIFNNWTAVDQPLSGTHQHIVDVGYYNSFEQVEVNGTIKAGGNYLNVLSYQLAGTPTHGVKIKTQIPFNNQGGMFSIDIKGYNYIKSSPLAVKLNFYMYGSPDLKFIRYKASSSGNWNPKIKLAEENGLVVVFIDEKEYYLRFDVDVHAPWHAYQNDAIFNNWTAVDQPLSGTHQHIVDVGYYNSFGEVKTDGPLTVAGKIHAREVKVTATAGADFVFDEDYALPSLEEVEAFVKANKHLPEIPSAAEMVKNGLNLAEMNIKLLQKVEELTLYLIEVKKENEGLKEQYQQDIETLSKRIEALEKD